MRDYTGVSPSSLPPPDAPGFQSRLRSMISDIDYYLRDSSRGFARIQQGQVPDGSGNQIGNNGTLTDYWFKPGIANPFIAYMSNAAGAGGLISSTSDQDKGFINLGNTVYVDEDNGFTGFQVTAPAAAVHIQPGVSGTTTLIPGSSVVHNWDSRNRTGAGGTDAGPFTIASLATSDDYTLYNGVGTLGSNTETVGMSGAITPNRVWTVTIRVACLGTTVDNSGNVEFHIVDSTGTKFTKTGLTGILNGLGTAFTDFTFTLDCTSGSSGSGTANTCIVGLEGKVGLAAQYIACTYFQISTGGDSDIARWNNGSGTLLGKINSLGYLGVNTDSDTLTALFTSESDAAASVVSIFKGATSQSGNLTEWQNQAGTILSRIASDGTFVGPILGTPVSVTDSTFTILDNADPTKTFKFELGGSSTGVDVILATSSTTDQTITLPNITGTLAALNLAQIFSATQTFSVAPKIDIASAATGFVWTATDNDGNGVWQAASGGTSFADNVFDVHDDGDATKRLLVSLGGATAGADTTLTSVATADRVVTLPNATGTLPTLENAQTFTAVQTMEGLVVQNTSGTTDVVATFRGMASQTGNLLEFNDNGTVRSWVHSDGTFRAELVNTASTHTGILLKNSTSGGGAQPNIQCLNASDQVVFAVGQSGDCGMTALAFNDTGSGFVTIISSTNAVGDYSLTIPDASTSGAGSFVLDSASLLSFSVLLGSSTTLLSSTLSSGASFRDTTTSTKRLRMVLSGAVGNNSFTFTNTAARNYGLGNLSGNVVVVGDDPPAVASGALGKVDLTAQTANIGTTNLSSTPPAGFYEVELYLMTTTADVTAGTLAVVIGWTDNVGATTNATIAAHPLTVTTTRSTLNIPIRVSSGDITYAVTNTGGYGTSAYAIYVRVISLG